MVKIWYKIADWLKIYEKSMSNLKFNLKLIIGWIFINSSQFNKTSMSLSKFHYKSIKEPNFIVYSSKFVRKSWFIQIGHKIDNWNKDFRPKIWLKIDDLSKFDRKSITVLKLLENRPLIQYNINNKSKFEIMCGNSG